MPYGLASIPSVFQCFVPVFLLILIHKFIITYIDILIYALSLDLYIPMSKLYYPSFLKVTCMLKGRNVNFIHPESPFWDKLSTKRAFPWTPTSLKLSQTGLYLTQ